MSEPVRGDARGTPPPTGRNPHMHPGRVSRQERSSPQDPSSETSLPDAELGSVASAEARGRSCEGCGSSIDGMGVRARFCGSNCRANAAKRRSKAVSVVAQGPAGASDEAGSVYAATLAELSDAGRADGALGAKCLAMARRIDLGADTGSALAALVRQHDATMAEAVKGAQLARTPLDELRARSDAKLA